MRSLMPPGMADGSHLSSQTLRPDLYTLNTTQPTRMRSLRPPRTADGSHLSGGVDADVRE
jgi:hypothetical protein